MDLQTFVNSRRAAVWGLRISRALPPGLGYRFASLVAGWIASRRHTPLVQALRANQWVVENKALSAAQLDQAAREVLTQIAYSYYTLFHYLEDIETFERQVVYSPQVEEVIARSQAGEQGLIALGVHLSSFDLIIQTASRRGLRAMALSLPQPNETVEWQHNYRRSDNLEIVPTSPASMRQAIQRLQAGGTVLTGADRPLPEAKYRPRFFGYPSNAPAHYIPLALKTGVPLVVLASIRQPDGNCLVQASDFLHVKAYPDRQTEIVRNAEMVLEAAEFFIRQAPRQWAISQLVWPELSNEVPQKP